MKFSSRRFVFEDFEQLTPAGIVVDSRDNIVEISIQLGETYLTWYVYDEEMAKVAMREVGELRALLLTGLDAAFTALDEAFDIDYVG